MTEIRLELPDELIAPLKERKLFLILMDEHGKSCYQVVKWSEKEGEKI